MYLIWFFIHYFINICLICNVIVKTEFRIFTISIFSFIFVTNITTSKSIAKIFNILAITINIIVFFIRIICFDIDIIFFFITTIKNLSTLYLQMWFKNKVLPWKLKWSLDRFKWFFGCMLPWSMYLIFLLAHNSFSSLLTLTAFCCNWSPLGMIDEMIMSHDRFKFFFKSVARSIILVAISVGVESLLRAFVPVCIIQGLF